MAMNSISDAEAKKMAIGIREAYNTLPENTCMPAFIETPVSFGKINAADIELFEKFAKRILSNLIVSVLENKLLVIEYIRKQTGGFNNTLVENDYHNIVMSMLATTRSQRSAFTLLSTYAHIIERAINDRSDNTAELSRSNTAGDK